MTIETRLAVTDTSQHSEQTASSTFFLGDIEIRPDQLLFVVDGTERRVEPRAMDLLLYGCERSGQLLSKEQIILDVWGGTSVVPEALQRVISNLRKSLDDSRDHPEFIETVSRKGYRFLKAPRASTEEGPINLTEKSVHTSPLLLIVGALMLIFVTWFAIEQFGSNDAITPRADIGPEDTTVENAPPPAPD